MDDLKIQVGANLYVLPGSGYAVDSPALNGCAVLISTAEENLKFPANAVVLGYPFLAAYDSTYNYDTSKVDLNISASNKYANVDICNSDGTCCEVASPCDLSDSEDKLSIIALAGIIFGTIVSIIVASFITIHYWKKNKTEDATIYESDRSSGHTEYATFKGQ